MTTVDLELRDRIRRDIAETSVQVEEVAIALYRAMSASRDHTAGPSALQRAEDRLDQIERKLSRLHRIAAVMRIEETHV